MRYFRILFLVMPFRMFVILCCLQLQAMSHYGFEIVQTLIVDIEPDEHVKRAMNEINAGTVLISHSTFLSVASSYRHVLSVHLMITDDCKKHKKDSTSLFLKFTNEYAKQDNTISIKSAKLIKNLLTVISFNDESIISMYVQDMGNHSNPLSFVSPCQIHE